MFDASQKSLATSDLWLFFLSGRAPKKDEGQQYVDAYTRATDEDKKQVRELIEKPWSEVTDTIYDILEKTL